MTVKPINDPAHAGTSTIQPAQKRTTASIYFLGGFQVFDKKGEDITSDFTPTIRQLFLLIYLSTLKNGKGVSSVKLKDTLWFDKSETKARNNRNVNISKLRTLLDKIGSIDLGHDNTYWNITLDTAVYCDYAEALALIQQSKSPQGLHPHEVLQLIHIVSLGELCPNIQTEWMDDFKADFANAVTDTLSFLPHQQPEIQTDNHLLLRIADCMLKFDMLNEDAIAIKCAALYNVGKKGLAKYSYDAFCREYKNMLGIDYPSSFNDLVNYNFSMLTSPLKNRTIIN